MASQVMRITMKAYDHQLIDASAKKINISNFFLFFLHITYYKISATPERATNQKPLYF